MRKDDLVLLKPSRNESADYTRARSAGWVCCIASVSGENASIRMPIRPEGGNAAVNVLYTKTVNVPKDDLELLEAVYDNVRRKA